MTQYLVRRRRVVVVAPATTRKHGGGGWLLLGLIAAVALVANNWNDSDSSPPGGGHTLTIRADASNACHADVTIGNHTFSVLLDTGAAGTGLVFGSNHAAALGLSPRALSYTQTYGSANGLGQEAIVQLHDVRLHGWPLGNVTAAITRAPQEEGLFGAELLHRLEFRTTNGFCILTMPDAGS